MNLLLFGWVSTSWDSFYAPYISTHAVTTPISPPGIRTLHLLVYCNVSRFCHSLFFSFVKKGLTFTKMGVEWSGVEDPREASIKAWEENPNSCLREIRGDWGILLRN